MPDVVELSIPARAELLSLARLTVASVAARADFDYEEIEDLRLALDELCSRLIGQSAGAGGALSLRYEWSPGTIEVQCLLQGDAPSVETADLEEQDLSDRILDALVDDHGSSDGTGCGAWLRKRRRSAVGT